MLVKSLAEPAQFESLVSWPKEIYSVLPEVPTAVCPLSRNLSK